jgi:hypothetical protein
MTASRARLRAEQYASHAPAGASVEVTEETTNHGLTIAQAVVRGTNETICVTISSRDDEPRSRASAAHWWNWSGRQQKIKVRDISRNIRDLYIHRKAE